MAIALNQFRQVDATTATFTSAQVAHNRNLVIAFWFDVTRTPTVADNINGAYTRIGAVFRGTNMGGSGAIYERLNIAAASANANTITLTNAGNFPTLQCIEVSGTSVAASYGLVGNNGNGVSPGTVNLTPTGIGDWGFASIYPNNDDASGAATGCTVIGTVTPTNGSNMVRRTAASLSAMSVGSTFSGGTETYVVVGLMIPALGGALNTTFFGTEC